MKIKKNKIHFQDKIKIPYSLIIFTIAEQLFEVTYPNIYSMFHDYFSLTFCLILTTKNDCVHEINVILIYNFSKAVKIIFVAIE